MEAGLDYLVQAKESHASETKSREEIQSPMKDALHDPCSTYEKQDGPRYQMRVQLMSEGLSL